MTITEYQKLIKDTNNDLGREFLRIAFRRAANSRIWNPNEPIFPNVVYIPLWFGSGRSAGNAVDVVASKKGVCKKIAKNIIKRSTINLDNGRTVYTDYDVAAAEGEDCVGMGSCQNYRIAVSDPDATDAPDISETGGRGWMMAGGFFEAMKEIEGYKGW